MPQERRGCPGQERRPGLAARAARSAPLLRRAREQAAHRPPAQAAQRGPDREAGRRDASQRAGRELERPHREAERARAHRAHPDGSQAEHHQPGVGDGAGHPQQGSQPGEHEGLGQERAAHARGGEADRLQQPQLAQPLLDAEAEEEPREQQRRHHQEEAEVDEVLAEVGRAARRGEGARPHVLDDQAARAGREPRREPPAERRRDVFRRRRLGPGHGARALGRRREPQRSRPAQSMSPKRLARGERQPRLRRRPVALPVGFVLRPDRLQVHGEGRVPVGERAPRA